ncbi:MAG: tetratricopeptide repeat protein [Bacteroidota bacterium]|nr:tetratricopeptide repeat protein [Bacteroidota bacterium]
MKIRLFALSLFVSSILFAQQNTELAFSKSYSFEYETQYTKAIAVLLDLNIDTYQINLRLGWLNYLNKDYIKSESYYKKAVAIEPASVEARFGHVLPLSALGNWNSVLNVYLEIIKYDPNNSIANYRIASIYYSRKEYGNASTYVNRVLRLYPFDYDSNLLYGKILLAQGKNMDAKKYLGKALEYNPQSDEVKAELKKL